MIGKLVTTLFIQLALINGELDFAVHIQGIIIYHYFYSNLETTCTSGGKDAADKLADRHGMVNMGEIIPETGFYLLRTRENNRRRHSDISVMSDSAAVSISRTGQRDTEVADNKIVRIVVSQDKTDYLKCLPSSLPTTNPTMELKQRVLLEIQDKNDPYR